VKVGQAQEKVPSWHALLFGALGRHFSVEVMNARFEVTLLLDFVRSIDTSVPLAGSLSLLVQATANWIDARGYIPSFQCLGLTAASPHF
jgi:hypothetical protein